jgi:hypothetical protein
VAIIDWIHITNRLILSTLNCTLLFLGYNFRCYFNAPHSHLASRDGEENTLRYPQCVFREYLTRIIFFFFTYRGKVAKRIFYSVAHAAHCIPIHSLYRITWTLVGLSLDSAHTSQYPLSHTLFVLELSPLFVPTSRSLAGRWNEVQGYFSGGQRGTKYHFWARTHLH